MAAAAPEAASSCILAVRYAAKRILCSIRALYSRPRRCWDAVEEAALPVTAAIGSAAASAATNGQQRAQATCPT
jgi:hypothetical protein